MNTVPDTFPALFWGYSVIWGILVLYIICLAKRISRIEKQICHKQNGNQE